jgi:hypothetical protein
MPQSSRMMKVAQEAVDAGELPRGTDLKLFLDTLFGSCLVKLLMRHESVHRYDTESFFDFAVAGARSYWGSPSKKKTNALAAGTRRHETTPAPRPVDQSRAMR